MTTITNLALERRRRRCAQCPMQGMYTSCCEDVCEHCGHQVDWCECEVYELPVEAGWTFYSESSEVSEVNSEE